MDRNSLSEIVIKAKNGDTKELVHLLEVVPQSIYSQAYGMLHNRQDALDIVEEVSIVIWKNISSIADPMAFASWVKQITKNKSLDFAKSSNILILLSMDDEENHIELEDHYNAYLPEQALLDREMRSTVTSILDQLPRYQRDCFYAYYYQGMSIAEIAKAYNLKKIL